MSKGLSKSSIGIRVQEFHEGLKDIVNFPLKDMHMLTTMLVGKAATLATHLKGGPIYIADYQALIGLASQLGISGLELRQVLNELEEVDFVTVVGTGSQIKRIELRIPELRDSYKEFGERWLQLHPSEIEQASVGIFDEVASFPQGEVDLRSRLGLSESEFNIIIEIGSSGHLVDRYNNDGESILYSPLTVEEKPDILLALAQQFPEDHIVTALRDVQEYQGVPIERLTGASKSFAAQAMRLGALCPVQITSGVPGRTFLFTPWGGLRREERVILEKARAILACVRYGEYYAQGQKIRHPDLILEALRNEKRFRYPHPDFLTQYGLLVTQGIGIIEPDRRRSGFYNFSLIDTPENMHALNIAIDLLKIGLSPRSKLEVDATSLLNISGTFSGTLPTRARLGREVTLSKEIARDHILRIAKLTRGVDE